MSFNFNSRYLLPHERKEEFLRKFACFAPHVGSLTLSESIADEPVQGHLRVTGPKPANVLTDERGVDNIYFTTCSYLSNLFT